jgi:hypothetical protein
VCARRVTLWLTFGQSIRRSNGLNCSYCGGALRWIWNTAINGRIWRLDAGWNVGAEMSKLLELSRFERSHLQRTELSMHGATQQQDFSSDLGIDICRLISCRRGLN